MTKEAETGNKRQDEEPVSLSATRKPETSGVAGGGQSRSQNALF
jgi:hypothetical protein